MILVLSIGRLYCIGHVHMYTRTARPWVYPDLCCYCFAHGMWSYPWMNSPFLDSVVIVLTCGHPISMHDHFDPCFPLLLTCIWLVIRLYPCMNILFTSFATTCVTYDQPHIHIWMPCPLLLWPLLSIEFMSRLPISQYHICVVMPAWVYFLATPFRAGEWDLFGCSVPFITGCKCLIWELPY